MWGVSGNSAHTIPVASPLLPPGTLVVMDGAGADAAVTSLVKDTEGMFGQEWKDPCQVATTEWRDGALDSIADPDLGSRGTVLVELELNEPHPEFYGIVRVDEIGIWYSDADGSPHEPAWRLRLPAVEAYRPDHAAPGKLTAPLRQTPAP